MAVLKVETENNTSIASSELTL